MVEPLELGRFISTCRKEKNLTQKQLGEELGVTDRAVSKWENGKSFPDISLIEPLCQILGISVSEFMLGKRIEPEHYQEETEKAWIASLIIGITTRLPTKPGKSATLTGDLPNSVAAS